MRFFIMPKKMFKKTESSENLKQKFYKKKSFLIIACVVIFLAIISTFVVCRTVRVPSVSFCEGVGKFRLEAYTKEDREEFFEQFSYKAEEVKAEEIIIPCESENFSEYNELQKSQGLDLMGYCGKRAQMYTLELSENKNTDSNVYGVLIVYKGRVVAAHITDFLYPACVKPLVG